MTKKLLNRESEMIGSVRYQVEPNVGIDDLKIRELFIDLWKAKWWILGVTLLSLLFGVFYAFSTPNIYKSEGVYAPTQKQGSGGLASQYGGIAAIAGLNLGPGESNTIDQAIVLIASWPFLEFIIEEHELKPLIMGVKKWNQVTGELIWDENIYDSKNKQLIKEFNNYEVYKKFRSMITATYDAKTQMVHVKAEHYSPSIAKDWVEVVVAEVNTFFQQREILEARKNITYLEGKILDTSITEMKSVFYGMVEVQLKKLMLAEVGDEYLLKTLVPPKSADVATSPKRKLLCVIFAIFGLLTSCMITVLMSLWSKVAPIES